MADEDFSTQLQDWLDKDSPKTLAELEDVFRERSFAVAVLLLMLPSAVPIPTGGVTHVLEAITVLLGLEMLAGRQTIWLPERWKHRELGTFLTTKAMPFLVRRIRWFERWSRPRLAGLFEKRWFYRVLGVVFIAFAVGAALAPPFSGLDTLPSAGAVIVALAIVLEDIVVLAVGLFVGGGGIAITITLGSALVRFIRHRF